MRPELGKVTIRVKNHMILNVRLIFSILYPENGRFEMSHERDNTAFFSVLVS